MLTLSDATPYIDASLQEFPILAPLFRGKYDSNWQKYLGQFCDITCLTEASRANFLVTTIVSGMEKVHALTFTPMLDLLRLFCRYLSPFTDLITNKKFTDKLLNLAGLTFANTISELSIAYWLKSGGFTITFEAPFRQQKKTALNDVDVKAVSPNGKVFYIEVYSPNEIAEDGFGDLNDQSSTGFKIDWKLGKKFGVNQLQGLEDGMVLLAVNTAQVDTLRVASVLAPALLHEAFEAFTSYLPSSVDGYLFFHDDFNGNFISHGLYLRVQTR